MTMTTELQTIPIPPPSPPMVATQAGDGSPTGGRPVIARSVRLLSKINCSPEILSRIAPLTQRIIGDCVLVDDLFDRVWEFPRVRVCERLVKRGELFVGEMRVDFTYNGAERTVCRVCGKHILKQKFATEHYGRPDGQCWKHVMARLNIPDIERFGASLPSPGLRNDDESEVLCLRDEQKEDELQVVSPPEKRCTRQSTRISSKRERDSIDEDGGRCSKYQQEHSPDLRGSVAPSDDDVNVHTDSENQLAADATLMHHVILSSSHNALLRGWRAVHSDLSRNPDKNNPDPGIATALSRDSTPVFVIESLFPNKALASFSTGFDRCFLKVRFNESGGHMLKQLLCMPSACLTCLQVDFGGVFTTAMYICRRDLDSPELDCSNDILKNRFVYFECEVPQKSAEKVNLRLRIPINAFPYQFYHAVAGPNCPAFQYLTIDDYLRSVLEVDASYRPHLTKGFRDPLAYSPPSLFRASSPLAKIPKEDDEDPAPWEPTAVPSIHWEILSQLAGFAAATTAPMAQQLWSGAENGALPVEMLNGFHGASTDIPCDLLDDRGLAAS